MRQIDLVDAIVLDILLPDANNPRTNRLFAELTQLPIIIHTSSTEQEADQLAKNIGTKIVRKDEAPEVLDAAVERVIDQLSNNN